MNEITVLVYLFLPLAYNSIGLFLSSFGLFTFFTSLSCWIHLLADLLLKKSTYLLTLGFDCFVVKSFRRRKETLETTIINKLYKSKQPFKQILTVVLKYVSFFLVECWRTRYENCIPLHHSVLSMICSRTYWWFLCRTPASEQWPLALFKQKKKRKKARVFSLGPGRRVLHEGAQPSHRH